jgi:5-formyltetrahydrofolate cyclo-ligase
MQNAKEKIRQIALTRRRSLINDEKINASKAITNAIIKSNYFIEAESIGCYLSMNEEVNTKFLIEVIQKSGKSLFLPKIQPDATINFIQANKDTKYSSNQYGIKEPLDNKGYDIKKIDLIIVPLVAFDSKGNRIGMGGGYYDKKFQYLNHNDIKPILIGIAFDCQQFKKIQSDKWDVSLRCVFTESGCIF